MEPQITTMIDAVIAIETGGAADGGYVNHPDDPGGATRWGVTEAVARAQGYTGAMRDYPRAQAFAVYVQQYVERPGFDRVAALAPRIGAELIEAGINLGPRRPSRWLQQDLNIFNEQASRYADIAADGAVGRHTRGALRAYLDSRPRDGELILTRALNCDQGAEYKRLCLANERFESFAYGWFRQRVRICPDYKHLQVAA